MNNIQIDKPKPNKRCGYVDIAKGITILSVVLLHVDFVYPEYKLLNVSGMLGWYWHVPVFFMLGGFFIKEDRLLNPLSFIKGKLKSLYLLSLYIYLPATLLHNVLFHIGWYSPDETYGGKIINEWSMAEYAVGVIKTLLCAGREPIVGAMWFVYVLLFALCGYCLISWFVNKYKRGGYGKAVVLLALQIMSCVATNVLGITIPRVSNAITAMFLIYIGQEMNNRCRLKFDNPYVCIAALLIVYESSLISGSVGLNKNHYHDVLQLTIGCMAALYAVCFMSKKIEQTWGGRLLMLCGRESFYIMGLHIVGFHICTILLNSLGIVDGGLARLMTPSIGNNAALLLTYTAFGLFFPLLFIKLFRICKSSLIDRKKISNKVRSAM